MESRCLRVLEDVLAERRRQFAKHGVQALPDGTGGAFAHTSANQAKRTVELKTAAGTLTYADILREEYREAMAEEHQALLRDELVQVAAVAVQWIEEIDRRAGEPRIQEPAKCVRAATMCGCQECWPRPPIEKLFSEGGAL
jgi:hypothetical protein